MRIEVHVHGSLSFCKGVTSSQIEAGLRKWMDYLDVENMGEMRSLERSEPGLAFDRAERILDICWTGEVGHNFHHCVQNTLYDLGPLLEHAAEIELTYYHDDGEDEYQILFAGPNAETIHHAQRRRMTEDIGDLLSRHFGQPAVEQVTALVSQLFDQDWEQKRTQTETDAPSSGNLIHFRHKHLH